MNNRKIGLQVSFLMALTLSFCLSLIGNLTAEKFQIPAFLVSFLASFVISLVIGFLVPMQRVESGFVRVCGLKERSLPARFASSFISDLIYTPVITLAMIALARKMASSHGAKLPPFGVMFGKALLISFIAGYIIIFIVSPVFVRLVLKKNGIGGPPEGRE